MGVVHQGEAAKKRERINIKIKGIWCGVFHVRCLLLCKYLVDEILKIRSEELEKLEKQAKDKKKKKPEYELIENEIKKKISEIEKNNQKVDKKIFKGNVEETILNSKLCIKHPLSKTIIFKNIICIFW